ncbi:HDOD domain-containing protein [Planctomicrobium piriforme]|uniref:HD-like signal output (HDOD) domain, no enzymatic activity n=1 Tax=Planctomicrobium piriforme TaxID=1576369 RepID=A0A1I3DFM0_9PLAN|nr:HDOD domain-containing protein [Planctomicrobium piriforme]SFH85436.1 HD-like signal output (HDOD) domain, no enzymatic activity [Planctomicrobium piriforme]
MVSVLTEQMEADVIAIPSNVMDRMGGRLQKMQMLPAIAQQALEMVKDPDCTIREFAKVIEQDIKLATEMLKVANSAIYSQGRPIASLSDAAMRLGMNQCKNLILTSSFASLIENFTLEEEWVRELLWRHGLAAAVIASNLNRSLKIGFLGEEFTGGLVHDIGRILLAVALPDLFLNGDPVDFQEHRADRLRIEQQTWGTTHTEVGAWFAVENRLPGCLVSAIRYHHFPARAPKDHQRLVALVSVADDMANYVQRNESGTGYDPATNPYIKLLEECGVKNARKNFDEHAAPILEKSCQDALELCGI